MVWPALSPNGERVDGKDIEFSAPASRAILTLISTTFARKPIAPFACRGLVSMKAIMATFTYRDEFEQEFIKHVDIRKMMGLSCTCPTTALTHASSSL